MERWKTYLNTTETWVLCSKYPISIDIDPGHKTFKYVDVTGYRRSANVVWWCIHVLWSNDVVVIHRWPRETCDRFSESIIRSLRHREWKNRYFLLAVLVVLQRKRPVQPPVLVLQRNYLLRRLAVLRALQRKCSPQRHFVLQTLQRKCPLRRHLNCLALQRKCAPLNCSIL